MSTLLERINEDWKGAMRSGDKLRRDTLSGLRAAIKNAEINARTDGTAGAPLDDAAVQQAVGREAKKRRDAIEEYNKAKRPDRAAAEQAELEILQEFLPAPLSEDELRAVAQQAIAEADAHSLADLGRVMKILMPRITDRADGKQATAITRQLLGG